MATILDDLADYARERVRQARVHTPQETLERLCAELEQSAPQVTQAAQALQDASTSAPQARTAFPFEQSLAGQELAFICECKKASPSKGLIAPDFPYLDIAREYEAAGADAISVLTEPKWFLGSDDYLQEIAADVSIPCLRKDFTVDEYMIYQAKLLGAQAVLLICSILDPRQLADYRQLADELGLSALVEAHDGHEIDQALNAGARIIGVNNRNLKDFSVDTGNSASLRQLVPSGVLFVAESGMHTAEDVAGARAIGADAVLVGESLMRAANKKAKLAELQGKRSE